MTDRTLEDTLRHPRILVVDDEEWNVDTLLDILKRIEPSIFTYVSEAYEGLEELQVARREKRQYQAVVVDYNMDTVNGEQFLHILEGNISSAVRGCKALGQYKGFDEIVKDCTPDSEEVVTTMQNVFDNKLAEYRKFVKDYSERNIKKILFSGSFLRNMVSESDFRSDVEFFQKKDHYIHVQKEQRCEIKVCYALANSGILTQEAVDEAIHDTVFPGDFPE